MEATPYVVYLTSTPKTLAIDPACQSDPFYRYKMRQLTVQTIGNGKMIRTSFTNLDNVAEDLKIPPSYVPHYLGKAIGAQAKYDQTKPDMQRGSISGEHATKELSNLLVRFIREFVLCGKCKLPELEYVPKKNDLEMRCHGCGWKGSVNAIGAMNEKFKRFVITHPPPPRKDTQKVKQGGGRGSPGVKSSNGAQATDKKRGVAKSNGSPTPSGGGEENVVWLSDTSEKAMEERMETMVPDRLKRLVALEGENADVPETAAPAKPRPAEVLRAFVFQTPAPTNPDIIAEVNRLVAENSLNAEACASLVFDALLSDLLTLKDKIKPYKDVLIRCIGTDALAQLVVLEAIENTLTKEKDTKKKDEFITKKAIFAFKELYDEDVIDEDTILSWYMPEGETEKKLDPLRKALQPFCKWLEEAEEESDEEGGEDGDEEGDEGEGEEEGEEEEEEEGGEEPAAAERPSAPAKPTPVADKTIEEEIDDL